ncbi:MAG: FAD-dependent oxidoreductase, partial [Clostridia bacterium]|nr:FAD-dependent oxidoreductase [Clostridia bacterium]
LMERGISPVIVEMADRILPLQLDAKAASEYQRLFENHGCSFRLAARASRTRLDSQGNVSALILEDGEELACDFIIAAAGVRPEIRFLEHCGVETGRAVTVDQYLSTSVPGVYGAGDVCGLSGIWPNAMKQGVTAAKNMCGIPTPYEDTYAMKNTMNFFGLPALCIGDINRLDSGTLVITEEDSKNYRKALVEDGILKSILMVGNISGSGIYQYLIKNQIKLPAADRSIFRLSFADFYGFDTSKGAYTRDTDMCCG